MNSRTKDMVRFKTLSKLSKAHSKIANDFTGSRLGMWLANDKKQREKCVQSLSKGWAKSFN